AEPARGAREQDARRARDDQEGARSRAAYGRRGAMESEVGGPERGAPAGAPAGDAGAAAVGGGSDPGEGWSSSGAGQPGAPSHGPGRPWRATSCAPAPRRTPEGLTSTLVSFGTPPGRPATSRRNLSGLARIARTSGVWSSSYSVSSEKTRPGATRANSIAKMARALARSKPADAARSAFAVRSSSASSARSSDEANG